VLLNYKITDDEKFLEGINSLCSVSHRAHLLQLLPIKSNACLFRFFFCFVQITFKKT